MFMLVIFCFNHKSIGFRSGDRTLMYTELIVMFMEPVLDNLCFVTWHIIMLDVCRYRMTMVKTILRLHVWDIKAMFACY